MPYIDVKAMRDDWREQIRKAAADVKDIRGSEPSLLVIMDPLAGDAGKIYVRNKKKACEENGIHCNVAEVENAERDLLAHHVTHKKLWSYDGVILQYPADRRNMAYFKNTILKHQDVDCLTDVNLRTLYTDIFDTPFAPCTAEGVVEILGRLYGDMDEIAGKNVTILGRSEIVGRPLARMLETMDATVTLCHSRSQVDQHIWTADIVISATGKHGIVNEKNVREGQIIIDVGITRLENGKVTGDADLSREFVENTDILVTPVPGGVGPMTITTLLNHVVTAAARNAERSNAI